MLCFGMAHSKQKKKKKALEGIRAPKESPPSIE